MARLVMLTNTRGQLWLCHRFSVEHHGLFRSGCAANVTSKLRNTSKSTLSQRAFTQNSSFIESPAVHIVNGTENPFCRRDGSTFKPSRHGKADNRSHQEAVKNEDHFIRQTVYHFQGRRLHGRIIAVPSPRIFLTRDTHVGWRRLPSAFATCRGSEEWCV